MKTINSCIYARVSTSGQQYDRQLAELREYADRMGADYYAKDAREAANIAKQVFGVG